MQYNPKDHGALCDDCPLNDCTPVGPELHPGAKLIVVGEAPGAMEVSEGRPFVGPSGQEAMKAFRREGLGRRNADWTNAIACKPEDKDMRLTLRRLQRENRKRRERGEAVKLSPVDYCRPRLKKELARHENILVMGSIGLGALSSGAGSIMDARGNPMTFELDGRVRKLFPTIHPSFALHQGSYKQVFAADVSKAWRYFRDCLRWEEPVRVYNPTPTELAAFLSRPHPWLAYDVETDGIEPLECAVRCIGIGDTETCLSIGVLGIDGRSLFYAPGDLAEIKRILKEWFTGPMTKVGHNAGYYDRMVIETWLGVTPAPLLDTILLHRLMCSELPHSLGMVGGLLTDVWGWKSGKVATSAASDHELHKYCLTDVAVSARIVEPVAASVKARGQEEIVILDHKTQDMCVGLHRNGMWVNQRTRLEFEIALEGEISEKRKVCMDASGLAEHNPNSFLQVGRLLYRDWGLTPHEYTELGDPSTADACMRAHLVDRRIEGEQKAYIEALRKFRRAVKAQSTFIRPMGVQTPDGKGLVAADGRLHADYNAHTPVTGRISSSRMNLQNVPKRFRKCMEPEKGRIYVGADMDQLELRAASAMANCEKYLEVFNAGGDPHAVTGEMLYGTAWRHGSDDDRKRMRDFAKRFVYAVIYGATDQTIHDVIVSVENDKGELVYADLALRETAALRRRWLREAPEFEQWWDATVETFRRDKFLADPIAGRRKDFLNGEEFNELVNYRVQAAGAAIVSVAAMKLIDGPIPFGKWGHGTGLVNQCHDALCAEVPADGVYVDANGEYQAKPGSLVARVQDAITGTMTMRVPGLDVEFTAEARLAMSWDKAT